MRYVTSALIGVLLPLLGFHLWDDKGFNFINLFIFLIVSLLWNALYSLFEDKK